MRNAFSFERYFIPAIMLLSFQVLTAQSAHQLQRQADREYDNSRYREAEEAYRNADKKKEKSPTLPYNTGNAVYQQGKYEDSEPYFEEAAEMAKNPVLKANALHNLGNAYLKQKKYEEAVNVYERSLRARPGDPQTKVNLQLAKKKLEQQKQEGKQNQDQQKQNQGNKDQQNQQDPNQKPDPQNQPQPNQDPTQPGQDQPQQKQQEQPGEGSMTRDQARRLLETAVGPEDQRNARKYRELEPGKHQTKPKKDW